jgi:hypothetical protein
MKPGKAREIEDCILTMLAAEEFWLTSRSMTAGRSRGLASPRVCGWVNVHGLKKLESRPEVVFVTMPPDWVRIPERKRGGKWVP